MSTYTVSFFLGSADEFFQALIAWKVFFTDVTKNSVSKVFRMRKAVPAEWTRVPLETQMGPDMSH